jgi:hypothetical protein
MVVPAELPEAELVEFQLTVMVAQQLLLEQVVVAHTVRSLPLLAPPVPVVVVVVLPVEVVGVVIPVGRRLRLVFLVLQ